MWQAHSSASLPESLVSVHCPNQCAAIDLMQRSGCTIGDSLSSQVSLPLLGVRGTVLSINGQQIYHSGTKLWQNPKGVWDFRCELNPSRTSIYLCIHRCFAALNAAISRDNEAFRWHTYCPPQTQKIVKFNEGTDQALDQQSFPESKIPCASQCLDRICAFQFMLPDIQNLCCDFERPQLSQFDPILHRKVNIVQPSPMYQVPLHQLHYCCVPSFAKSGALCPCHGVINTLVLIGLIKLCLPYVFNTVTVYPQRQQNSRF